MRGRRMDAGARVKGEREEGKKRKVEMREG